MSYDISKRSVIEFITDTEIKLPRFQRKSTWKPGQNFELIISMAKEYPLGVVVINREQKTSWLLDGRQRLSALKDFRNDPNQMYEAAKKYLKFSVSASDEDLKKRFWDGVETYLINISKNSSDSDNENSVDKSQDVDNVSSGDEYESGIDRDRQQEGLKTILDVIRFAHFRQPTKKGGGRTSTDTYGSWERLFKLDEYLSNLTYQLKKEGYVINSVQLRKYLLELGTEAEEQRIPLTQTFFIDRVDEMIKDGKEHDFKEYVDRNWSEMSNVIETIVRYERLFRSASIGEIVIQNVAPLDALNIFTKINKGGSQLTPVELNSAKPFWNEQMEGYSPEVDGLVKKLYERLNISTDGSVVKWDLVATLMHRIKDNNIIFEKYDLNGRSSLSKPDSFPEIDKGFKLISSYFTKGTSNVKINSLESCKDIRWPQTIDDFVDDFNNMCRALKEDILFSRLMLWERPLIKLIGESATYEFTSIMLDTWKSLGEPCMPGSQRNTFHRKARILFDTLMYEYATGYWRGTGDQKMSNHVKFPENRFIPTTQERWDRLIHELCTCGQFNGSPISTSNIDALVYYQFILRGIQHPFDAKYEIDHTIPKALIKNHQNIPEWFMDSLINRSILPDIFNNAKKDRRLSDIKGTSIGNVVSKFIGIEETDFDKYSDLANLNNFIESRTELLKDTFRSKRQFLLSN